MPLLKFITMIPNSVFKVANIYGMKLFTRLRVDLRHLRIHKFRHNFQDPINSLCSYSLEIELTYHFFLLYQKFVTPGTNLMNEFRKLDSNILNLDEISLSKLLLYGDSKNKNKANEKTLLVSINFVLSSKPFNLKANWRDTFLKYMPACNFSFLFFVYILRFTPLSFMRHYMDVEWQWGLVSRLWFYYFYFTFIIIDTCLYKCIFIQ